MQSKEWKLAFQDEISHRESLWLWQVREGRKAAAERTRQVIARYAAAIEVLSWRVARRSS